LKIENHKLAANHAKLVRAFSVYFVVTARSKFISRLYLILSKMIFQKHSEIDDENKRIFG
jgi:hypothetical protein